MNMLDTHRTTDTVVVVVAPVAHEGADLPSGTRNPTTPAQIGVEVARCADAGASVVHLHVRDKTGRLTEDTGVFSETLDLIAAGATAPTDVRRPDSRLMINGSTGGLSTLTREQRCTALNDPRVDIASLNMGSVNFGESTYINDLEDIRYWARRMNETQTEPELEVFSPGMIENINTLRTEGTLRGSPSVNFCLGVPGAFAATVHNLDFLVSLLPSDARWGLVHAHMESLAFLAAGLAAGASWVRVGFEDSASTAPGESARTNAELVERLVSLIRIVGLQVASPSEARAILGLTSPESDRKVGNDV